jgi:hypothetical protein
MRHNKIVRITLKKHIRGFSSKHKNDENIDDIKLGSGLKKNVLQPFQIERNNPDSTQSLMIAKNQSASSIATGGESLQNFLN